MQCSVHQNIKTFLLREVKMQTLAFLKQTGVVLGPVVAALPFDIIAAPESINQFSCAMRREDGKKQLDKLL